MGRKRVNIYEAKTHLSELVGFVAADGASDVVIARAGKPVARLTGLTSGPRRLGLLDGRMRIPDDFNRPLPKHVLKRFGAA